MKKITNSKNISDYEALTDTGFKPISNLHTTVPYEIWNIKTDSSSLDCADNHIVFLEDYTEIFVKDLCCGDKIWTVNGLEEVILIHKTGLYDIMYDLEIDDNNHRYYTNDILSHNTSIVEGLAVRIVNGEVPISLQGKEIYTLELTNLVAGTKYRGQFEERMKAIIEELKTNPHIIIFIDEMHTLVGAGASGGSLDASNIIKPALARGEIRCIGATTFDEYRTNIEDDGALSRRFQQVTVEEPSYDETIEILTQIKDKYEKFHLVKYSAEVIEQIVKLADRYILERFFPDKAIDIMDEAGSFKRLENMKLPKKIKNLEDKLKIHETAKKAAAGIQDYEKAAEERDKCNALKKQIKTEKEQWEASLLNNMLEIEQDDLLKVVSKWSGVPIEKLNDKENKNLLGINKYLKTKVIGQDEAIDKISTTIQRNRVGIRKKNRTMGNFIFLGPTGTGKCVTDDTLITVKNDLTGEIQTLTIFDFKKLIS